MEEKCEQDRLMVGVKTLACHLRAEHGGEDVPADDAMIQSALRAAPGETGWIMGIPRDAASPKQGGGGEATPRHTMSRAITHVAARTKFQAPLSDPWIIHNEWGIYYL